MSRRAFVGASAIGLVSAGAASAGSATRLRMDKDEHPAARNPIGQETWAPVSPLRLPADLLLGSATSATQIEGDNVAHSWSRLREMGKIVDGSHTHDSVGHWDRVAQDVDLLCQLNQGTYRLSIEWTRLEPSEKQWDERACRSYRRELELLHECGIVPLLTLHHFTKPLWIEDKGGWTMGEVVDDYVDYVEAVVARLGDLVSDWVTINEPNVYASHGYMLDIWPPAKRSLPCAIASVRNMLRAHIRAY